MIGNITYDGRIPTSIKKVKNIKAIKTTYALMPNTYIIFLFSCFDIFPIK